MVSKIHQEITDFLAGEELLRVKAFIGQGNSTGAKARAAAAAAEAAKLKAGLQGGGGGGEEGDMMEDMDDLAPKQRLKGQTQKEQKVNLTCTTIVKVGERCNAGNTFVLTEREDN